MVFFSKPPKRIFTNLRKVDITDGAHMQTSLNETLFGIWVINSNEQMVCIQISLYYDNIYETIFNKVISFSNLY